VREGGRPFRSTSTVLAALGCFLLSSLGFWLLLVLMEERPQFVGEGLTFPRRSFLQDAPSVALRKVGDDVSAYVRVPPDRSDVRFELHALRDHRGLKTVHAMEGELRAEYTIENPYDERVFVLFRCDHPRSAEEGARGGQRVQTSGISMETTHEGQRLDATDAWLWSGELDAGEVQRIAMHYRVPRVTSVGYRLDRGAGSVVPELDVAIVLDDPPPMVFGSGEGPLVPDETGASWRRRNAVASEIFRARIIEGRNVFGALRQLLQVGPFVTGLFLAAVIGFLSRRRSLGVTQVLTIATAFAFYFPLMLYLSAKLSFGWALLTSFSVPGMLLLNYARLLVGVRVGVLGGLLFLLVYQVFPTLTAFAGWNRGLVLLCVGAVTLFVLIDLQNRSLRLAAAGLLCVILLPSRVAAQRGWIVRPAEAAELFTRAPTTPLLAFGIADYRMELEREFVEVHVTIPVEVLRQGDPAPLFSRTLFLLDANLPEFLHLTPGASGLDAFATATGSGEIALSYRAPLRLTGERIDVSIPLARAPAGRIRFRSRLENLEFVDASLWSAARQDDLTEYTLGTSGADELRVGWSAVAPRATGPAEPDLYGIGIASADHLTVLNSDGTALHFAVYHLVGFAPEPLELELPPDTSVISVTVDGLEIERPEVKDGVSRIRLETRGEARGPREVALRLDLGRRELGFLGTLRLLLPRTAATTGQLKWTIAFPSDFAARVMASNLDSAQGVRNLTAFGEYGEALRSHSPLHLAKTLVPPRSVRCELRYHQILSGLTDSLGVDR
jgi:hypothetical protein